MVIEGLNTWFCEQVVSQISDQIDCEETGHGSKLSMAMLMLIASVAFRGICYCINSRETPAAPLVARMSVNEAIWQHAATGNLKGVEALLKKRLSQMNLTDEQGRTALALASFNGHTSIVKFLMSKQADPSIADHKGKTPLFYACERGKLEVVKELGILAINQKNNKGRTPLMIAAWEGHDMIVDYLLKQGADPAIEDKKGQTVWHYACDENDEDIIHILLEKFPEGISAQDYQGNTPLHELVSWQDLNPDLLLELIGKKADPTAINLKGESVVHHAGTFDGFRILCEKGADPVALNNEGYHALHLAVDLLNTALAQGRKQEVIYVLQKIDLNVASAREKKTLLHMVIEKLEEPDALYDALVKAGADPSIKDINGQTPAQLRRN